MRGGLPAIILDVSGFSSRELQADAERGLVWTLETVVIWNMAYLHANPGTPKLYDCNLRYERDAPGKEWWKGIERILETKRADCKSLSAYRVAELRTCYGEDRPGNLARFDVTPHQNGSDVMYHVTVTRGDGSFEDPSRIFGMGKVIG